MNIYERQSGIISTEKLKAASLSLIGAGGIGSFAAVTLAKMGVAKIEAYDEDGVSEENIPNQFYKLGDLNKFKTHALHDVVREFSECELVPVIRYYDGQPLQSGVVVATDSVRSRKMVWEHFKKQDQCRFLIEGRMGAELGYIYTIQKNGSLSDEDRKFYEAELYSDSTVKPLPCTARSIIYNVLMISSLIARSLKGILNGEAIPREQIFNMTFMEKTSWMIRA